MKVAIGNLSDITKNKNLCMLSFRANKECHKCFLFKQYLQTYKDIEKALDKIPCNPNLPDGWIEKYKEYRSYLDKVNELRKELWK